MTSSEIGSGLPKTSQCNLKWTRTGDSNNGERLRSEDRKDHGSKDRCKKNFIDTVAHVGLGKHIERESESWKDAGRVVSRSHVVKLDAIQSSMS